MIFLNVLKIIGIVLLCIIALALVIALMVLLIPLRYKIIAKGHNVNTNLVSSVKWLFGVAYFKLSYIEGEFDYFLKIFGIKLNLSEHDKEKDNIKKANTPNNKSVNKKQGKPIKSEIATTNKKSTRKKKKKRISFKERLIKLLNKIKKFFQKVKEIKDFLSKDYTKNTIKNIKELIIKCFRHIFPRKIVGNINFGLNDPAKTALVYGLFASWAEQSQKGKLLVTPDFEDNGVILDLKIYGRLFVGYMLISYLRLILNKDYKRMVESVRRIF